MEKFCQFVMVFFLLPFLAQGQEEILMRINGKPVTKSEFERIYHKKYTQENASDPSQVREYLTLFVNFRLNVMEAEQRGMDTLASFRQELQGYRDQLAKSYMKDTLTEEEFARQEYERLKWEVRAAHIFVRCPIDAAPEDTLRRGISWPKPAGD
jgi:peptidyl-prolyl cis-trans isomerase SurA